MRVVAAVGGLAVLVAFAGTTWHLLRFIFKVDRALPTLLNIAKQFESNSGSTLRDKIEDLHARADLQDVQARVAVRLAEDSRTVAQTNAAIVNELSQAQTDELAHVRTYLHDKLHEVSNDLAVAGYRAAATDERTARIEERLDKLLPLVIRRDTDRPDDTTRSAS